VIHYCTHFDQNYLARGLVLYRSLKTHSQPFALWVLCLDDETYSALSILHEPMIRPIRLQDFEAGDAALAAAKGNRSRIEYYFTCTPSLPLFVFALDPTIDRVTYLDADLRFFGNPDILLNEVGPNSIAIVPHLFPPAVRHNERFGRFNVGLVVFRNDATGRACLTRWREQCLEWCYDRVEGDRYADQKYLDKWPDTYAGVHIFEDPGVVMGPWNFVRFDVTLAGGQVSIDGRPLIVYHFAGFKEIRPWIFELGIGPFGRMPRALRMHLYRSYVHELHEEVESPPGHVGSVLTSATVLRGKPLRNMLRTLLRLTQGGLMFRVGPFWL
jgi:hypothetical protein